MWDFQHFPSHGGCFFFFLFLVIPGDGKCGAFSTVIQTPGWLGYYVSILEPSYVFTSIGLCPADVGLPIVQKTLNYCLDFVVYLWCLGHANISGGEWLCISMASPRCILNCVVFAFKLLSDVFVVKP